MPVARQVSFPRRQVGAILFRAVLWPPAWIMDEPKFWTTDHREWYRTVYLKSDHWLTLRASKLKENPVCERCGSAKALDVHHVCYRQLFDVTIQDLLTLCRKCHDAEHEKNGMPVRQRVSFENYFPKYAADKISKQKRFAVAIDQWSKRWWERKDLTNTQRLALRTKLRRLKSESAVDGQPRQPVR